MEHIFLIYSTLHQIFDVALNNTWSERNVRHVYEQIRQPLMHGLKETPGMCMNR